MLNILEFKWSLKGKSPKEFINASKKRELNEGIPMAGIEKGGEQKPPVE